MTPLPKKSPIALLVLAPLLIQSCGRPTHCDYFDFDFQKPLGYDQLIFRSAAIVVGTVISVNITREGVPARKAPHILLDETRVEIRVENVLLGEKKQGRLFFTFFGFSKRNGGYTGPPPYRVVPGERHVFFLTQDAGEYRSAGDVRDYTLRVRSGLKRDLPTVRDVTGAYWNIGSPNGVGEAISAALLELGENYSVDGMVSDLAGMAYISDTLATRRVTASRLSKLLDPNREGPLRVAACLLLAERYPGQYGCLSTLGTDQAVSNDARNQIAAMKAKQTNRNARLKRELRRQPLYAFSIDSVVGVRDELELLLDDPDSELRQLACTVMGQNYGGTNSRCTAR